MRDESVNVDDSMESELDWRRQNATLVTEAKRNGVDAAVEMLWSLSQDGTAVTQNFNQVVSLLASRGRLEDGIELACEAGRRGVANIITFRPLMKWCCAHGDGRSAKRVWKSMSQYAIDGDMFLYAELMGALVRSQDMVSAQKVVTSLHESGRRPHIVLYNTLLKGYAKRANVKRGFEIMKTIDEAGIKPDETVRIRDPFIRSFGANALSNFLVTWMRVRVGTRPRADIQYPVEHLRAGKGPKFSRSSNGLDA